MRNADLLRRLGGWMALALAGLVLLLGGCSQQKLDEEAIHGLMNEPYPKPTGKLPDKLRVLVWPDTFIPEVIADFEKRYGVKLEITTFANDDEAYQKLTAQPEAWDVVMVSQYMGHRMRVEGLLQPVPRSDVQVYREIDTIGINPKADPQMRYFIPFDYAALGISFNVDYVGGFPRKWEYLTQNINNPFLYGRVVMTDDMRFAFSVAMLYAGRDPTRATKEDLLLARDLLVANVKEVGLRFLPEARIREEMINQSALLAITWSGEAAAILKARSSCRFLIPEGPCIMTCDGFSIPKGAPRPEASALLIEYMLHPYPSYLTANTCMYASTNLRSMKHVDRFLINGPSTLESVQGGIIHMKSLSADEHAQYRAAWAEVKAAELDPTRVALLPLQ